MTMNHKPIFADIIPFLWLIPCRVAPVLNVTGETARAPKKKPKSDTKEVALLRAIIQWFQMVVVFYFI